MKEQGEVFVYSIIFGVVLLLAFKAGNFKEQEKLEEQAQQYEKQLVTKELQLTITQTAAKECRAIVDTLEEKGHIEPRPLIIEE